MVHWYYHAPPIRFSVIDRVASSLPIENEPNFSRDPCQIRWTDRGQFTHTLTGTDFTCKFSSGSGSLWAARLSKYKSIASRMFAIASSSVSPSLWHPFRAGQYA
jgi:hypothetical protein